ncbi:MAG: bifunctional YncE family protein/alkaline phosphatase family protein [Sedimentisphaerales bacterium]|nr:bifunctional YncE family protein/alkaline phosphatase family protein [Sedimentisphaerales bacterium]
MKKVYRDPFKVCIRIFISLCVLGIMLASLLAGCSLDLSRSKTAPVGLISKNRYILPTGQILTPAGQQIRVPGLRPQALALSPDGELVVTSGKNNHLYVIDAATGNILQKAAMPGDTAKSSQELTEDPEALLSLTGLIFSPDGRYIYLSNVRGDVKVFSVNGKKVSRLKRISVPNAMAPKRKEEIPTGLALSEDGKRLYVSGNLGNKLYEFDTATGQVLRTWETGAAPFDVVLAAGKAYVSNSGGRRSEESDMTAPSGVGTKVRVDPVRYIANEGSVSIIDLGTGQVKKEVIVGLHASALAVSPDGQYVVAANSGSDTLSVIDTQTDQIAEKIWMRQSPGDPFGAQPNALAFHPDGKRLFVCNGTQNAVAVVRFEPAEKESAVIGLIPVGWFPGAVAVNVTHQAICVANIKGIGAAKDFKSEDKIKLRSKDFYGTLSLIPIPSEKKLFSQTKTALQNMRYPRLKQAKLPPRPEQPVRPVPERFGEPSVFKHVIYIIKENRTYDQILGDMPEGNGDPELCTFGEKFTPNQHKIAREFVLMDNTYCCGVQSADGHQWTDSGIANEYTERQLSSDFPRSYSSGKDAAGSDALSWSSSGFIWDNALSHGKWFRNYGEWMISESGWKDHTRRGSPQWIDYWNDYQNDTGLTQLRSRPVIESLRPHSLLDTEGYNLKVPDVMRAAAFIKELKAFEAKGEFPDLVLLFLPNDHTGGTKKDYPTPGAQIADNDLALGMVVEAISHSKFWPETCLFVIEDDPQAGWDHVSGYRTTCYVVSPYTKRRQTISTRYDQTSLIRTMELILGLPPMNQLDAAATTMFDCFTERADLTPFTAVANVVPLDTINPAPDQISNAVLRQDAIVSAQLPLDEVDACPEDVFNRILWRAMKGPQAIYPEWAVKVDDDD